MAQIHVVHENAAWVAPLLGAPEHRGWPYCDWHLAEGARDLTEAPPEGVFHNLTSASSHGRAPNALRRRAGAASVAAE